MTTFQDDSLIKYSDDNEVFDILNEEEWMNYLDLNGFCVIRSVVSTDEVLQIKQTIWNDLSTLYDAKKDDSASWHKIPTSFCGIFSSKSITHTLGPWMIRSLETVRRVFRTIWQTDDLLVSMDSIIIWLPWGNPLLWKKPISEGLHLDQNPFHKPNKECIQGMVPLIDVTEESGGLEVVPRSHLPASKIELKEDYPVFNNQDDWCVLSERDQAYSNTRLVRANAGDLILWDSRTIHGARVGKGFSCSKDDCDDVARMSIPVCMTPRSFATAEVLQKRQAGFLSGSTFTHWPHEADFTKSGRAHLCPFISMRGP